MWIPLFPNRWQESEDANKSFSSVSAYSAYIVVSNTLTLVTIVPDGQWLDLQTKKGTLRDVGLPKHSQQDDGGASGPSVWLWQ